MGVPNFLPGWICTPAVSYKSVIEIDQHVNKLNIRNILCILHEIITEYGVVRGSCSHAFNTLQCQDRLHKIDQKSR